MPSKINRKELEDLIYEDVKITQANAPRFVLDSKEIDIWSEPYNRYHSKSPVEYVTEKILECEKKGLDPFPSIVGKKKEKELVKNALLSGSPILFKGKKGYGKTTFSKAIAELLPSKLLAVKGCKIYDDPTYPSCFSCKRKLLEDNVVELTWIPRIWVRIPGDPMLTTRQLVGGVSIQKIREGYDLDHPEVFIPGRALKANRGVGYFDELGALPSSLQTLLHELFEEHQITTVEGDIIPFKINTIELAATNPANYRGTNPIKEPLLDRMEEVSIGPPETLEEEIEIGLRNMYYVKWRREKASIPSWHLKVLARTVRYARDKDKCELARRIESEPSCRATIKLYDHLQSKAIMMGRKVPLFLDYGESLEIVKLALRGRIEVEYGIDEGRKDEIIEKLFEKALKHTCEEVYNKLPQEGFDDFYEALRRHSKPAGDSDKYLPINLEIVHELRSEECINFYVSKLLELDGGNIEVDDEYFLSAIDVILMSMSLCIPEYITKDKEGYILHEPKSVNQMIKNETGM